MLANSGWYIQNQNCEILNTKQILNFNFQMFKTRFFSLGFCILEFVSYFLFRACLVLAVQV
ncbi:hypothetical protein KsCSTR_02930 [Candidatus Kuenenia stuttgartiensis]|uniref:Uncharacterized protein n=1 Tax=Kuenenia stuttgartiensis TaxID=174633 RepID=Q1PY29_KUEST|nr:hypothetical protein KsCSTR_02930 [Candidatus Kuenenia stuttgartiensis]CAJ72938.1 unknown protein [Candidatus Kuenenia stuttgartiensis]